MVFEDNLEAAAERAREGGMPLLVSFTSHTCATCQVMEAVVFERPEIEALRAKYVEARLHLDAADADARERISHHVEEIARTMAQPTYVILDSSTGSEVARLSGSSLNDPSRFVEFLEGPIAMR